MSAQRCSAKLRPSAAMAPSRTSVYVAEDQPLYLNALVAAIKQRPDLELIGSAAEGRAALDDVRRLTPDVLVLDLRLPGLDGQAVVNAIERDGIPTRVLIVSAHVERHLVYDAIAAGAVGFLSKLTDERAVCEAIVAVGRGESVLPGELQAGVLDELRARHEADRPRLTDRELAIVRLLAAGGTAPAIAEELSISVATVRTHLQSLYGKLDVATQAAAVAAAMRLGLVE